MKNKDKIIKECICLGVAGGVLGLCFGKFAGVHWFDWEYWAGLFLFIVLYNIAIK